MHGNLLVVNASPPSACRTCGAALASPAEGVEPLCLACLLDSALAEETLAEDESGQNTPTRPLAGERPPAEGCFAHYTLDRREDGTWVELGRGGMGVTYRATDQTLGCAVALKVVSPALAQDARARARFLREAQAAAGLRHPHVASVFFFGERPQDGQLFYAMELVEGETLHARVRRGGGLPAAQVLEIGAQVAAALAAAEARGLAHRDLKPANLMLVEGEGVNVKVIDFGLAKAAAGEPVEGAALTGTQEFVGTPAFASPEHFNVWQEVDLRSDFYALGATLWYALTGHAPFSGRSPQEIRDQQLRASLPHAPLRAARVPRPLEKLLRSLLSPDPAGRPQTARELVRALDRCRQTPARKRAVKLLAAVAGVLALAFGLWLSLRHNAGDIVRQNSLLQRQALAQQQQLDTLQAQLRQQTQLIALVSAKIDRSLTPNGTAVTTAQAEIAQERGVDVETLQKQLAGEQADVRAILVQIDQRLDTAQKYAGQWRGLKRAALTRLGEGEYAAGHFGAAADAYRQTLALADADKEPLAWCDAAQRLVFALRLLGRADEGVRLIQQAVERRTALQGPEHPGTLKAINERAHLFFEQGDLGEAETLFRRVLEARERILGKEHPDTLRTASYLAWVLQFCGKLAEAETLGRRCLEARERTLGREHPDTLQSVNMLAVILQRAGNYPESAALNRRCLEAQERLHGPDHPETIVSVANLGAVLQAQGNLAEAEPVLRRALAAQERIFGPDHPTTLTIALNVGLVLFGKGDYAATEPVWRRCLDTQVRTLGPDHYSTLLTMSNLAQLLDAMNKQDDADKFYAETYDRMARHLSPQNDVRLDLEHYFSLFREKQGRLPEALALAAQVAEDSKDLPANSPVRHTYEEHFRALQARAAVPLAPAPSPMAAAGAR